MRRISHLTKEAFCFTRVQITAANERLEHWAAIGSDESYKELVEINEALVDSFRGTLLKLVAIEFAEVAEEFGITESDSKKTGSAFPYLQDTEIELNESIIDYCVEIVDDLIEVYTIPATIIADELEEWLSELAEWHLTNGK